MDFARETLFDVIEEVQPLLEAHYAELTRHKDVVKLDPRWGVYSALEKAGAFVVLTARDSGKLVGYSAYFLNAHLHYAGLVVAQSDVFFIVPEHRKGSTPVRFLRYCEQWLKEAGAMKIVYHCKTSNNFAPILHHLGFQDEEVMTAKLLIGA